RRRAGTVLSQTLVVREEEKLVLEDRSTEGAAELVPAQWRPGNRGISVPVVSPVVGIELVIAKVFEQIAMKLVGAGLDHHVDDATLEVSKFRGSIIRDHPKFLDRIQIRLIRRL